MSLHDVTRLKVIWENEYPQQSTGGRLAIAGFHYQFQLALLETVRAWLSANAHDRSQPRVFTETLSDIVRISDDKLIVITQAKFTRTSSSVLGALNDLWRIHAVARKHTPDLLERLQFRIISARSTLRSVEQTIEHWRPSPEPDQDAEVEEFKHRVVPIIEADPEEELLALLADELRASSPLHTVQTWLSALFDAATTSSSYDFVGRMVWNSLCELDRAKAERKATGIHVWSFRDRAPQTVGRGNVLTGEQPLVRHLREGYFAPRGQLFDELGARAEHWIGSDPATRDPAHRLQFFWIGGRSGSGKSVALLHVLAFLHDRGHGPILWLGNKTANLAAAIRWSSDQRTAGRRILIAVDDPYAPANQGSPSTDLRDALAEVQELREAGDVSEMPLILCCGPTEQAERLRDDWPDDVCVEVHALQKDSPSELEVLRAWYRDRTGRAPPPVGDENVLLVQLFFEWRTGIPIAEFSSRFRRRIEAADPSRAVLTVLSRTLALNRLYVGYCTDAFYNALDGHQRDVVATLLREDHLIDRQDPRLGIWLAHAHLSNAIYNHWYPEDRSDHARTEHLKEAVLDALRNGATPSDRAAPLWALSRFLGSRHSADDFLDRLTSQVVYRVFRDTYEIVQVNEMPPSAYPVWIQAQVLAPDLGLIPAPIPRAIILLSEVDSSAPGVRLVCHKLLEHLDALEQSTRDAAIEAIRQILITSPDWKEWPFVTTDAILRTGAIGFCELVADWYPTHSHLVQSTSLLLTAIRCAPHSSALAGLARREVVHATESEDWAQIAIQVFSIEDAFAPSELQFFFETVTARVGRAAAPFLAWAIRRELPYALSGALRWAKQWHLEPTANLLLEVLCFGRTDVPEAVDWVCRWIRVSNREAGFVLQRLVRARPQDPTVRALGREWLSITSPAAGSWTFVWEDLLKADLTNEAVQTMGREWLRSAPGEHASWPFVWQALWHAVPHDGELLELGVEWLRANSRSNSWSYVWNVLWGEAQSSGSTEPFDRSPVIDVALIWLQQQPPHRAFGFVWFALWRIRIRADVVRELGIRLLESAPIGHSALADMRAALNGGLNIAAHDDRWPNNWAACFEREMVDSGKPSPETVERGRDWVFSHRSHPYWASVFLRLCEIDTSDADLLDQGRLWISEYPQGRRADEVLSILGGEGPKTDGRPNSSERVPKELSPAEWASYETDTIVQGTIVRIGSSKLAVSLGPITGHLYVTHLPVPHACNPKAYYEIGQEIRVVVIARDMSRRRVTLALASPPPRAWPRGALATLRVGQRRRGLVMRVIPMAAFVAIGEIAGVVVTSNPHDRSLGSDVRELRTGQSVWVEVVTIDVEREWVELSTLSRG